MEAQGPEIECLPPTAWPGGLSGADRLRRAFAALSKLEDAIGVLLSAALVLVVLVQVLVRFLLYRWLEVVWAEEVGRALLVWMAFWGAVLLQRESNHISVDVLYERLSPDIRWPMRIIADVLITAFLAALAWYSLPIFLDSLVRQSPATGLPAFIFDGPLWISCALMLVHIAVNAFQRWRPGMAQPPDHRATAGGEA